MDEEPVVDKVNRDYIMSLETCSGLPFWIKEYFHCKTLLPKHHPSGAQQYRYDTFSKYDCKETPACIVHGEDS